MKKNIHIYTQYYYPIANACSNRVEKYVLALKENYNIKIVTWMPNYPTWKKTKEYKWKLFKKQKWIYWEKIIRTYEFATSNSWSFLRILNYTSFMISSFLYWLFNKKPDIIIITSPPLFTALSVLFLNKIRKIPYILEVRDLWPDSVVALWFMKKNSFSYKVFFYLEKQLYKNATKIIWVTKWICSEIEKKWFSKEKIVLQYNVAEVIDWNWLKNPYNTYSQKIKWRKIALFAGNMNEAYDFKKTVEFVKENNNIFFVFIWDGSQKFFLENSLLNLKNVLFLERKSKKEINKFLYFCNSVLVPLKDEEFYKWTFPVKWIEWIVNKKEIIFFGPIDWEFNMFLENIKSTESDFNILEFEYFKNNIIWIVLWRK